MSWSGLLFLADSDQEGDGLECFYWLRFLKLLIILSPDYQVLVGVLSEDAWIMELRILRVILVPPDKFFQVVVTEYLPVEIILAELQVRNERVWLEGLVVLGDEVDLISNLIDLILVQLEYHEVRNLVLSLIEPSKNDDLRIDDAGIMAVDGLKLQASLLYG